MALPAALLRAAGTEGSGGGPGGEGGAHFILSPFTPFRPFFCCSFASVALRCRLPLASVGVSIETGLGGRGIEGPRGHVTRSSGRGATLRRRPS